MWWTWSNTYRFYLNKSWWCLLRRRNIYSIRAYSLILCWEWIPFDRQDLYSSLKASEMSWSHVVFFSLFFWDIAVILALSNTMEPGFAVQFRIYSLSVLLTMCHEWSAAPISTCLRRVPRGCFHNEFFHGGESTAAQRVNCCERAWTLAPTHQCQARGWTTRKNGFSSLRFPTRNRTQLWWRVPNQLGQTG